MRAGDGDEKRVVALSRGVARGNRISRKQPPRQQQQQQHRPKIEGAYVEMRRRAVPTAEEEKSRSKRWLGERQKNTFDRDRESVERHKAHDSTLLDRVRKRARGGPGLGEGERKKDVRPVQF